MPDAPAAGEKTRLTMTRYTVGRDGTTAIMTGVSYTVMINPADIRHARSIVYDDKATLGQSAANPRFASVGPERVNFSILIDGTGAVPAEPGPPRKPVKDQLALLEKVVFRYTGELHEPGHVRMIWGSFIFFGRLDSMSTQYTLFKPSGEPLRARVELGFISAMSKREAELAANRSSPDLSHRIEVREGDTLPLLCQRVYGDPAYYVEVARYNGLVDFRRLEPGRKLHFPPLG